MIVHQSMRTHRAMRALLTYIALLVFAPIAVAAQLSLTVPSTSPRSSVLVSVLFTPGADSISGLQFDLHYDGLAISLLAIPGESARLSGKSIFSTDLSPNDKRFVVIDLNQNSIPQGALISLFVVLNANALGGEHSLTLTHLVSADPTGQAVPTIGANGSVTLDALGSKLQADGVLNAASLNARPVAPGEIITLIGSGIGPSIALQPTSSASSTELGGTSVLFDGRLAPLLYASPNQINAIVPYGVSGEDVTQMSIMSSGQVIARLSLPASETAPAIFTRNSTGVGPGAILNQDTSLNSPLNPADRGSIVVLFATGGGQTDPPGVDGQVNTGILPRPTQDVSVKIGGINAEIEYAGAAPGLIAGLLQVNCKVPENVTPGSVPIVLKIGGASSPAGVVLSIR
jgi:uncharacterized protein (TIGR03437 family)